MNLRLAPHPSPIGDIFLVTDDRATLRALDFADCETRLHRLLHLHYGKITLPAGTAPGPITRAIAEYFDGNLHALTTIPIATAGTDFQQQIWAALREIPPGATTSYGALAAHLGRPAASRAVGHANGANPISIVIPCHRLIGAAGALTGYAGGLPRKRWLLDHEMRYANTKNS